MSYGKPKTSPYGDSDQFDDTWTQAPPESPQFPTSYQPLGGPGQGQSLPAQGGAYRDLSSYQAPTHPQNPTNPPPLSPQQITQSITPEDLLFVRKWQQDSFYYRVLPMTTIGSLGLFLYNRSKGLPLKPLKFFVVGAVSYVIGKISYRGEFQRRLLESQSNTPFMQASRKALSLPQIVSTDGFGSGPSDFNHGDPTVGSDALNWNASDFSRQSRLGDMGNQQPSAFGQPLSDYTYSPPTNDQQNLESPKQAVSYEELRARNRGFIR